MRWPWRVGADLSARVAQLEARQAQIPVNIHTATEGRSILLNSPDGWEVDQPWLWWTGGEDWDGTWGNPPPGAGAPPYGPRSLPAVQRCTHLICDTLAGLPWDVLRGWESLDRPDWISDPQALRLDGRVVGGQVDDIRFSATEFYSQWIRSALWYGDGYLYAPVRASNGQPAPPLWIFHPDYVAHTEDMRYEVEGYLLPEGSVLHLRWGEVTEDGHGTGVLRQHGADLGLALSTRRYAHGQYRAGVPSGYLKSEQPHMEDEEARELQRMWMKAHGSGRRSIAVLNATTSFTPISVTPLDAQLDLARQWSLRDIALAFNIPAYMLGVPGDSSTYANVQSRMIEFRMFTLLPWTRRIEPVISAQFPRGTEMKIKTAGLERADTTTRYAAYKTALESGFMSVDEVRALEDLPPLAEVEPQPVAGAPSPAQLQIVQQGA